MMPVAELITRNKCLRTIRVSELEDAPWNFRTHPDQQRAALDGAIDELGFYGYPDVYETADGTLRIIDGHLRKSLLLDKYGPDTEIEVNVTDFDEAQAKKATLTKDPLAALAEADTAKLDALLREVETGSEALTAMLAALAKDSGLYVGDDATPPADFNTVDENIPIEHVCPKCGYAFSGGTTTRAMVEQ